MEAPLSTFQPLPALNNSLPYSKLVQTKEDLGLFLASRKLDLGKYLAFKIKADDLDKILEKLGRSSSGPGDLHGAKFFRAVSISECTKRLIKFIDMFQGKRFDGKIIQ